MTTNFGKQWAIFRHTGITLVLLAFCFCGFAQKTTQQKAGEELKEIEKSESLSFDQKIAALNQLKSRFEQSGLPQDSVYARIFNRIGFYDFKLNHEMASNTTITSTLRAAEINRQAKKQGSAILAVNCYLNSGIYYESILMYYKALDYFDTSILLARNRPGLESQWFSARFHKISIYLQSGDYQKAVEESTIGLTESRNINDSVSVLRFFSQRAISNYLQSHLNDALADADTTILYAGLLKDNYEKASALKVKALVNGKQHNFSQADLLFRRAIDIRIKIKDVNYQLADDYTDYGNFYLNEKQNYAEAIKCYNRTIAYASAANDVERMAKAHLNLGVVYYQQHNFRQSLRYYMTSLDDYRRASASGDLLQNPPSDKLTFINNKELLLFIFNNKTEVLVSLYKQTKQRAYLFAALQTALLTDTLITAIRHEQSGELSKLYWRSRTRQFFANAIEACFLNDNARLAFLFMEKSRAVLLNDKLNEIGAAAYLPETEAGTEQQLQIKVVTAQQKLNEADGGSAEFNRQLLVLLSAKDTLERYIKSLDNRFPAYFQYKYEDNIPTLMQLQKYLSANRQSFVHYFITDSVAYMVCVSPRDSRMIRLSGKDFDYSQLARFTQLCSERGTQNLHYDSFATLSHTLYKKLFQPLAITEGRVIICPDNFFLPFEALCTDGKGEHFLVSDYAISYVYSARYLFRIFKPGPAEKNFIGFAPASFSSTLHVVPLKYSVAALDETAKYYKGTRLLTNEMATKDRFLTDIFQYSVVNIFSHAYADTSNNEPVLYMHDAVIHLSELRRPVRQATRLVVLSACLTNVGRQAIGEGIYSLARGFASVGIPSVAATCWKADELSTYTVSQDLHKFITQGMAIDVAMQKAKAAYLQDRHTAHALPYFWANMVVIGNAEPVKLIAEPHTRWWITAAIAAVIVLMIILAWYGKKIHVAPESIIH